MIPLIIWLICVLLVAGAVLALVRAILALPFMADLAPYGGVIYALVVLLIVLVIVGGLTGNLSLGPVGPPWPRRVL